MWIEAASCPAGSAGLNSVQRSTTPAYCGPPTRTTFVAPAPRIALTISWLPAAVNGTPGQVPPSRIQVQAAVVLWLLSGYGSVLRFETNPGPALKVAGHPGPERR